MTIVLEEVLKKFGEQVIVNKVSLDVADGELFVLLGSSGSGKSTVLRIIAGLLQPESGRVILRGEDVTHVAPQKRGVGFVFQNYALFRHMSVSENIEFGLKIRGQSAADRKQRRDELLEIVGLTGLGNRLPDQLSGGQRQRVALARALAYRPSVLLLDEPFGALDVKIRGKLRQSLKALQKQLNVTTVLVTHDQEEAFELGDRIGVVERGRLVEIGTPHELYHTPRTELVANFIGGGNVLVGRCHSGYMRLGKALVAMPSDAPAHSEGAPVRVLFRPEWVSHAAAQNEVEAGLPVLGRGTVRDRIFGGASEKTRFELDDLRGTQSIGLAHEYGQRSALIDALHNTMSSDAPALGEERWIGLRRYHILQPSSLRILVRIELNGSAESTLSTAAAVAGPAYGTLTLLAIAESRDENERARELLDQALETVRLTRSDLRVTTVIRRGDPVLETVLEAQEGYFDLVVIKRDRADDHGTTVFSDSARHMLANARVPVLLVSGESSQLKRALICTAGGEPGKGDVRFAARLARHTGATAAIFHARRKDAKEGELQRLERHLERAQSVLTSFGVESEVIVEEGPPLESLMNRMSQGWDFVVIGAPGRSLLLDRDKANFNTEVLARTEKPVLIVPTLE